MGNLKTIQLAPLLDQTGSYVRNGSQIANGNPLTFNIYYLLRKQYGAWLYGANSGSNLSTLENSRGDINNTQLSQLIQQALQPLINQNKITIQNINIVNNNDGNYKLNVTALDIQGEILKLSLPLFVTN